MPAEAPLHLFVGICKPVAGRFYAFLVNYVVSVEDCPCLMPADLHGYTFRCPGPDHVPYCRPSAVVEEPAREFGCMYNSQPEIILIGSLAKQLTGNQRTVGSAWVLLQFLHHG